MGSRAEAIASKRARRSAMGLCTECETPRLEGHSVCEGHFKARQARRVAWNRRRQAAGLCYCGSPAKPGQDRCASCLRIVLVKQQATYQERKDRGLCVSCGAKKSRRGKVFCRSCAERAGQYYLDRKERRQRKARAAARRGQLLKILAPWWV